MNYTQLKRFLSAYIPNWLQNKIKTIFLKKGRYTYIISPQRIDGAKNIKIGKEGYIGSRSTLSSYGGNLVIGPRFYATRNLNIYCGENIEIGKDVLIGSFVLITDLSHGIDADSKINYQKQPITTKPVFIGSGCWLGDKVSILPGTKIGKKCVIAANSVVIGDIPSYTMIAGNPAKVIKKWSSTNKAWIKA